MCSAIRSLLLILAAGLVLLGSEPPRLTIHVVDHAMVEEGLATPWWTTDGPQATVLIPPGSPPLPISDRAGILRLEDFERFLNGSTLNPHRAAAQLLGLPTRREAGLDGGTVTWQRVVLRDRQGIGFHAHLEVTANGAQCAWTYTPAPVLR